MLLDLRETIRNSKPIKYTLITIICIPFVLFGIGSYFSAGGPGYAAKVDGAEISAQQLESAYSQQRRQMAQMFGGQLPEGFGDEAALRQQALDGLVRQQVLRNTVAENKFTVSDKTLASAIQDIPAFRNAEGGFDRERYLTQLRSSGMSVDAFENSFREDTALAQFQSGIVDTSFVLPSERELNESLARQVRTVDAIRLPLEPAKESIEIADDEVQTYFDENAENYTFPQRVKINYIRLNRALLSDAIDVTDEEAQEYFDANKGNYLTPEERKASHILLTLDEDASEKEVTKQTELLTSLRDRVESGESFEDLAKEFSQDPGSATIGGSLGQIAPGVMVPAFEQAVFSLAAVGDLSNPVRTQFGLHLIKVDEIISEKGETFDQAKPKVIAEIKNSQAQAEFIDLQDLLAQEAFDNADSLDSAAEVTGLEVQSSDWIDGGIETPVELGNPAILAAALSEDVRVNGNNSDIVELGADDVIVLRTEEYEGPRPKTIDDVREDIVGTLKTEKAGEGLDKSLETALTDLKGGKTSVEVAEAAGGELSEALALNRQSNDFDRNFVAELFKLPKPADGAPVYHSGTLSNGDRVALVFEAISVEEPETEEGSEATVSTASNFANPQLGGSEFGVLLKTLQGKTKVETNERVLSGEADYGYGGGGYGGGQY